MAPSKTSTMKSKHAAPKASSGGGVSKPSKSSKPKGPVKSQQVKEQNFLKMLKKPKKKSYTDEELGIPKLNMITPVGVIKPKGKKKGKVFVDDKVSYSHLLPSPLTPALTFHSTGEHEHYPCHCTG